MTRTIPLTDLQVEQNADVVIVKMRCSAADDTSRLFDGLVDVTMGRAHLHFPDGRTIEFTPPSGWPRLAFPATRPSPRGA